MKWTARLSPFLLLLGSCSSEPTDDAETDTLPTDVVDADVTDAEDAEDDANDALGQDVPNQDVADLADLTPSPDVDRDLWDAAGPAPDGQTLTPVQSPTNALAFYVDWTIPEGVGTAEFRLECGRDEIAHEFRDRTDALSGELFLIGLLDDVPCRLTLATDAGITVTDFTPGPLPEYLPEIEVEALGEVQPGWTLVNLNNHFEEAPLSVALFDEQGRYRWYHYVSAEMGSDNEVTMVQGGVIIGGRGTLQHPQRIDWRGREVWALPGVRMHHDIRYIDEDTIRFLADGDHCGNGVNDGRVEEFNVETREVEWTFKLCEF